MSYFPETGGAIGSSLNPPPIPRPDIRALDQRLGEHLQKLMDARLRLTNLRDFICGQPPEKLADKDSPETSSPGFIGGLHAQLDRCQVAISDINALICQLEGA